MASDNPLQNASDQINSGNVQRHWVTFIPAAGRLPTPKSLADYAAIDPNDPARLMELFQLELKRNYRYQLVALVAGWTFALALAVEAGLLAVQGQEKMALALIGANAVGFATRVLTKAASRG